MQNKKSEHPQRQRCTYMGESFKIPTFKICTIIIPTISYGFGRLSGSETPRIMIVEVLACAWVWGNFQWRRMRWSGRRVEKGGESGRRAGVCNGRGRSRYFFHSGIDLAKCTKKIGFLKLCLFTESSGWRVDVCDGRKEYLCITLATLFLLSDVEKYTQSVWTNPFDQIWEILDG